ncbi:hypothetical protein INR49_030183, partial [Caranx melampygus]
SCDHHTPLVHQSPTAHQLPVRSLIVVGSSCSAILLQGPCQAVCLGHLGLYAVGGAAVVEAMRQLGEYRGALRGPHTVRLELSAQHRGVELVHRCTPSTITQADGSTKAPQLKARITVESQVLAWGKETRMKREMKRNQPSFPEIKVLWSVQPGAGDLNVFSRTLCTTRDVTEAHCTFSSSVPIP